MTNGGRPILSLTPLVDPNDDRPLELGVYDVLLPCRRFLVDHKIAAVGSVSLTAEFMLRLVKSTEGISEDDAATFFGFDRRDMSFVLTEVEIHGYLERNDGRLWLTKAGQSLFRPGSRHPEIFEVEERRDRVGFDLIALAPQDFSPLDDFQRRLPELKLTDPDLVSSATRHIAKSYHQHYSEITSRRDNSSLAKRSLYSIDNISAADRFSSTVRISVRSTGSQPSTAEPDLSSWRPDFERDDRSAVVEATARFVEDLATVRRPLDQEAYQVLVALAPEFLKDFTRRDGLAIERYYREAFVRAGEVRTDRPTVPLLGSLFARENTRRLFEVADYGLRTTPKQPPFALWITPQVPHWGATVLLSEILTQIKSRMLAVPGAGEAERSTIALVAGRPAKHVEIAFDIVATSEASQMPPALEILLIPNVLAAVMVVAPIGASSGMPVPLGFVSFDEQVIRRAHAYVLDAAPTYSLAPDVYQTMKAALSGLQAETMKE